MKFLLSVVLLFACAVFAARTAEPLDGGIYDYVIVGAGPGASILANKLSEKYTVLMLETGPYSKNIPKVWRAETWLSLQEDPTIEYGYTTTPQPQMNNNVLAIARAKMTGGCGAHNGMIYELGSKFDYDGWAALGNQGWSWADLEPLWREIDGKIDEDVLPPSKFYAEMARVLEADGYKNISNPNLGNNIGYHLHRFMADKKNDTYARRITAYEIWVDSVLASRDNLNVEVFTRADRILFNGNNKAYGVLATNVGSGKTYTYRARREVIVSGGVVESPKLLMLSGIGDSAQLRSLGIPVVAHVPGVGKNFRDHIFFPVFGPPLKDQNTTIPQPIYSDSGYVTMGPDTGAVGGSLPRMYSSLFISRNFLDGQLGFGSWVEALKMKSTGEVTLRSKNPEDLPIVNPKYLSHPDDIKEIVWGVRQARKWLSNPILLQFTEPKEKEIFPGWAAQSDAQIEAIIRQFALSDFHPAGTCKMGPASDPLAVVDNQLRVRGTQRLRVIDSSVFPTLNSGNPNQPTMIVSLKGAKMILGER